MLCKKEICVQSVAQSVAIVGGGPAGLMAAEVLIRGGALVHLDLLPDRNLQRVSGQ